MNHAMQGHPRQWVLVESSGKTWFTGGGNGKPFQYSCGENQMNMSSVKRRKDMTLESETARSEGVQYATEEEQRALLIAPERMKWLGQSGNNAQLWMCLMAKVKSSAAKNSIS